MTSSVFHSYFHAYEVGKFYRVPCVETDRHTWLGNGWLPVLGPLHEDRGAVNFPWAHWHVDWRFVDQRKYREVLQMRTDPRSVFGVVIQRKDTDERFIVSGEPTMRRMKCKREFAAYPASQAQWLPALEREFAGCKMKNMVCPHRGLPLRGCPQDGDVVTCPGHGLRWNIKTGELVTSPSATGERS
jgi:hypothetical protein